MQYPWKTSLPLQKESLQPLYLQLVAGIIAQIQAGYIKPDTKLPGSRTMASLLGVHRTTVICAYNELYAQGWIEQRPSSGTYVSRQLPVLPLHAGEKTVESDPLRKARFSYRTSPLNELVSTQRQLYTYVFDDGFPDARLAPWQELAQAYTRAVRSGYRNKYFSYVGAQGIPFLRQVLASYLNMTRGIRCSADTILITQGSQMGLHLSVDLLVAPSDHVIIGQTSYFAVTKMLLNRNAHIHRVPVDQDGVCVDSIRQVCERFPVKMIYLTPHHHHPSTVTLTRQRRLQLLELAHQYGFAILEDDYDYDFHYDHTPVLPLASMDTHGMVVYTGSFSKTINPAIRLGYVVAPADFIAELRKCRQLTDHQGNPLLEHAMAELLVGGEISRYLKKALRAYRIRRDLLCHLLRTQLGNAVQFAVPEGGMAVWCRFADEIKLPQLANRCKAKGLFLTDGTLYDPQYPMNSARLGFSSLHPDEIKESVHLLKSCLP